MHGLWFLPFIFCGGRQGRFPFPRTEQVAISSLVNSMSISCLRRADGDCLLARKALRRLYAEMYTPTPSTSSTSCGFSTLTRLCMTKYVYALDTSSNIVCVNTLSNTLSKEAKPKGHWRHAQKMLTTGGYTTKYKIVQKIGVRKWGGYLLERGYFGDITVI